MPTPEKELSVDALSGVLRKRAWRPHDERPVLQAALSLQRS